MQNYDVILCSVPSGDDSRLLFGDLIDAIFERLVQVDQIQLLRDQPGYTLHVGENFREDGRRQFWALQKAKEQAKNPDENIAIDQPEPFSQLEGVVLQILNALVSNLNNEKRSLPVVEILNYGAALIRECYKKDMERLKVLEDIIKDVPLIKSKELSGGVTAVINQNDLVAYIQRVQNVDYNRHA